MRGDSHAGETAISSPASAQHEPLRRTPNIKSLISRRKKRNASPRSDKTTPASPNRGNNATPPATTPGTGSYEPSSPSEHPPDERTRVRQRTVHPELRRRVRIDVDKQPRILRPTAFHTTPAPFPEEQLFLAVRCLCWPSDWSSARHDTQNSASFRPPKSAMFSPSVSFPSMLASGSGLYSLYLIDDALGAPDG